MTRWLVGLDVDQIKQYVYNTGRLAEIQGASALLDNIGSLLLPDLASQLQGKTIYSAGGAGLFSFGKENHAQTFLDQVRAIFNDQTVTAFVSGVVLEYDEHKGDGDRTTFSLALQQLPAKLQMAKLSGKLASVRQKHPLFDRCQRCGQLAVVRRVKTDNVSFLACESCAAKREAGAQRGVRVGDRLKEVIGSSWPAGSSYVPNLGVLGEMSTTDQFIGLIHADGNGIGAFINQYLDSEEKLGRFSKLLDEVIHTVVADAVVPHLARRKSLAQGEPPYHVFLPVLIGGDDLVLITVGEIAMDVAHQICKNFQQLLTDRIQKEMQIDLDRPLTMSAGVVIAKSSHPIFAMIEMAEELLAVAKAFCHRLEEYEGIIDGAINYRVVKNASARPWRELLDEEYKLPRVANDSLDRWGTARPFPLHQSESQIAWPDMQLAIEKLATFPRNKLHQWRELLRMQDPTAMAVHFSQLYSRLHREDKQALEDVAILLGLQPELPQTRQVRLFLEDDAVNGYISPLPDIVELFDFAQK